jgi:hypothetical protein
VLKPDVPGDSGSGSMRSRCGGDGMLATRSDMGLVLSGVEMVAGCDACEDDRLYGGCVAGAADVRSVELH